MIDMWSVSVFWFLAFASVSCDVSHYQFYEVPLRHVTTSAPPFLPEIIINKAARDGSYSYQPPQNDPPTHQYLPPLPPTTRFPQPPVRDEIPDVSQGYIPPLQDPISVSDSDDISDVSDGYTYQRPPTRPTNRPVSPSPSRGATATPSSGYDYSTSGPLYLPPESDRSSKNVDLTQLRSKTPIKLRLNEMRCLANQGGYFKTILTADSSLEALPVVDTDVFDPHCDFRSQRSFVIIDIPSEHFQKCGVTECGNSLCLRIRFPHIRGMRTSFDSLLTLQCKLQDRVVEKTHSVKMGVSNEGQGRSATAYAQGGSQLPFHTQIAILRKTDGGFSRNLEPHGVVQLGEELMLRAQVRSGDGWNFTKMSDIKLQRVSPSGEVLNSVSLVKSNGCVNPTMRTICPLSPLYDLPLGFRFPFRAVMFDGMSSGDEMLLSVKLSACLDQRDCYVNANLCDSKAPNLLGRFRRDARQKSNATEQSEVSTISFRVRVPDAPEEGPSSDPSMATPVIIGGVLAVACIIILIALLILVVLK